MKKITAPRRSTTLVILTIIGSCRSAPGTLTMQSPHGRGALATRSCHAGAAAESGLASLPRAYTETGFHYFHFRDFSLASLRRRTPLPAFPAPAGGLVKPGKVERCAQCKCFGLLAARNGESLLKRGLCRVMIGRRIAKQQRAPFPLQFRSEPALIHALTFGDELVDCSQTLFGPVGLRIRLRKRRSNEGNIDPDAPVAEHRQRLAHP